jgi:hypothetical protein
MVKRKSVALLFCHTSYIQYANCTLAKLNPLSHLSHNYEEAIKFL